MGRADETASEPGEQGETQVSQAEIERLAYEKELALGYREAARRALGFARLYREEEGSGGGERERACITQAQLWRRAVRDLHAGRPSSALPARPGVAPARPREDAAAARDETEKTGKTG